MVFFTFFRFLVFIGNLDQLDPIPASAGKSGLMVKAFFMGYRFDTVVSGYILAIPLLLLSIAAAALFDKKIIYKIITVYTGLLYTVALAICAADVGYYTFFHTRFSAIILNWADDPGILTKMILEDPANWRNISLFFVCCTATWIILFKFKKKILEKTPLEPVPTRIKYTIKTVSFSIVAILLLFVAIRGRIANKSPIRVGTAYFSNYAFPNQLGLSPVFTFFRSCIDWVKTGKQELKLMADEKAVKLVQKFLNVNPKNNKGFSSPIARKITAEGKPLRANVILVIMESMAAGKMGRYGSPKNLTPNLDRMAAEAYSFDHFYTSGTHTANGLYSPLFAFPTAMKQHPLKPVTMLTYAGLSNILKDAGYKTAFFLTHDKQFDNIGGFMKANGFEQIISQVDYPAAKVLSTLGVPDDFMFEFSIPRLNEMHKSGSPFLAVLMTVSDHPPFIIPAGIPFTPKSTERREQIVEYADWAIGKFLKLAARQEWFENTLFVFVADHGSNIDAVYDMPLSYFHSPFIIYAPALIKEHRTINRLGGQIDVFPTIMGLLNIPYVNNTLGMDLLKESRPFIYFCADNKLGCLSDEYFLVLRENGGESLYAYKNRDTQNYSETKKQLAKEMKDYLYSMLQTSQWLIKNRKVGQQQPSLPVQPR